MQQFKMIYFGDYAAASSSGKRGLSVPFSGEDLALYDAVAPLSSYTLRRLLRCETYGQLISEAEEAGAAVATFCRDRLRSSLVNGTSSRTATDQVHDALQATFSGGRGGALHDWYPYLEGYSPAFVTTILKQYGGGAKCILDPFAGAGTTPITAVTAGLDACYAEVNPLCRAVTDAKLLALSFDDDARKIAVDRLRTLSAEFPRRLRRASLDKYLAGAHDAVFGRSEFFDPDVFKLVLRARSLLDILTTEDSNVAAFATIAVIRSLVPASRLVRRGDLRFKTKVEAERLQVDFVAEVQESLNLIASDIADLHPCTGRARYVGDDAKALEVRELTGIDSIITSPPYLNGTNYFRNTKIELWFLRCLRSGKDLSDFRYRAITAGINDVTVAKADARRGVFVSEKVAHVVDRIARAAYDRRIPQMVETYFGDLFLAFNSCVPYLPADSLIAVDIGDSCYGDVHVPTDDIVAEMLSGLDCRVEDQTILRERLSRGGQPLRQTLQIFRRRGVARRCTSAGQRAYHDWQESWSAFKAQLPHQQGVMAKRNWGHGLHSLCSYQGKLKPSIAHWLVNTFVPKGGRVVDPFAGVGTIPLEAALSGRRAFAFDISPPALQITHAKVGTCDAAECDAVIADLAAALERFEPTDGLHRRAAAIRFNGPLEEYFHRDTFREVLGAREYFIRRRPENPSVALVFACLLHILHGNRPYALSRTSHPITPFAPTGPSTYRALLPRLRDKVVRSLAEDRGPNFVGGSAYAQDATSIWPDDVHDLDAVITSPPFFDSTRFHTGNWMRLWFAGWEASDFKTRPLDFVDERQKRSFEVYEPVFASAAERLKSRGVLVLHLGHSRKCDMAAVIRPIAERHFRFMDQFVESVAHCESHGVRDKGTVTAHQYLVLERA